MDAFEIPIDDEQDQHNHVNGDGSWPEFDAQGIYLCRVCDGCEKEKLSQFRPEILSGYSQADVDEPIEEE